MTAVTPDAFQTIQAWVGVAPEELIRSPEGVQLRMDLAENDAWRSFLINSDNAAVESNQASRELTQEKLIIAEQEEKDNDIADALKDQGLAEMREAQKERMEGITGWGDYEWTDEGMEEALAELRRDRQAFADRHDLTDKQTNLAEDFMVSILALPKGPERDAAIEEWMGRSPDHRAAGEAAMETADEFSYPENGNTYESHADQAVPVDEPMVVASAESTDPETATPTVAPAPAGFTF